MDTHPVRVSAIVLVMIVSLPVSAAADEPPLPVLVIVA